MITSASTSEPTGLLPMKSRNGISSLTGSPARAGSRRRPPSEPDRSDLALPLAGALVSEAPELPRPRPGRDDAEPDRPVSERLSDRLSDRLELRAPDRPPDRASFTERRLAGPRTGVRSRKTQPR